MHIGKGRLIPKLGILKLLFRRPPFSWICWQKQNLPCDLLSVHYQFRNDISFEMYLPYVEPHIELLHMLGHRVTVEQSRLQIDHEYIGQVSYWCEGRLLYREYLQMQVEYIEKKKLSYLRLKS